jgi:hypothetical protein
MNTNNETILARLAVGAEAVDDGLGAVIVATDGPAFCVYVSGGILPDGATRRDFADASAAYAYASGVAAELAAECLDAAPSPGQAIAAADPRVAELAAALRLWLDSAGDVDARVAARVATLDALAKVQP